ncbi:MAG: AAA family ATPase [Planctomycetes bacterium]|nr:AAA family ATPase [Planctomycetota bacterium]
MFKDDQNIAMGTRAVKPPGSLLGRDIKLPPLPTPGTRDSQQENEDLLLATMMVRPELINGHISLLEPDLFVSNLEQDMARICIDEMIECEQADPHIVGKKLDDLNRYQNYEITAALERVHNSWGYAAKVIQPHWVSESLAILVDRLKRMKLDDILRSTHADLLNGASADSTLKALEGEMSCLAPIGASLPDKTLQSRPIPASQLAEGESIEFIWDGFVAVGYKTLFSGLPKVGKTTAISHLLKACGEGGQLGTKIEKARVLVVSEEGGTLWARRRDDLGFGDYVHFKLKPFLAKPSHREWVGFIDQLAEWVHEDEFDIVILDTFASLCPLRDENSSAEMLTALLPLEKITAAGAALLLIHHSKKGDAGEGQASRGSGALVGFVDVSIEIRRFDAKNRSDSRRVLTTYSRFDETPDEIVLELTADGDYEGVGSKSDAKEMDRLKVLRSILPTESPGASSLQIHNELWEDSDTDIVRPGERTIRRDLKLGAEKDTPLWQREGTGRSGNPFTYFIKKDDGEVVLSYPGAGETKQ